MAVDLTFSASELLLWTVVDVLEKRSHSWPNPGIFRVGVTSVICYDLPFCYVAQYRPR